MNDNHQTGDPQPLDGRRKPDHDKGNKRKPLNNKKKQIIKTPRRWAKRQTL